MQVPEYLQIGQKEFLSTFIPPYSFSFIYPRLYFMVHGTMAAVVTQKALVKYFILFAVTLLAITSIHSPFILPHSDLFQ